MCMDRNAFEWFKALLAHEKPPEGKVQFASATGSEKVLKPARLAKFSRDQRAGTCRTVQNAQQLTSELRQQQAAVQTVLTANRPGMPMPNEGSQSPLGEPSSEVQFVRRVLIVVGIVALAALLWALSEIFLLVFGSVLLAVSLRFVATLFAAHTGMRKNLSLILAGVIILGLMAAAFFLFRAQLGGQLDVLLSQLQAVEQTIAQYFNAGLVKDLLSSTSLGALFARALSWGTTAVAIVASLLLVIVGGVFMAIDPEVYCNGLIKLFPPDWHPRIRATLDDAGAALRLWLGAQVLAMLMVGTLMAIGALLIGIPSPLALGLIFGLTEFVPVIGPIVGAVPVLLVAVGQSWEMALWALGLVVSIQQIESNLILPLVSGRAVQLPPADGLFAVVAMGVVFGPLGLVLGYPLAVVCDVAIRLLYVRQTLGEPVEIVGEKSCKDEPRD
jgi:predicted PurR-regulated permease PerM